MDAFFGIFARAGEPVAPAHLAAMAAAFPRADYDHRGEWMSATVALGHLAQWNTPEARAERQPVVGKHGRLVYCGEARIDNRPELLEQLASAGGVDGPGARAWDAAREKPITDADLILAAYARWGADAPAHLVGDYAFVLWDTQTQEMLCVRDAMGPVPFYYHLSSQWLIFANDLRAVLAHPAVDDCLDDDTVAAHLKFSQYVLPQATFFTTTRKLPAGHVLRVNPAAETQCTFWTPEAVPPFSLDTGASAHSREEYLAHFRTLFERAIADRLRTVRPVAAHVSGGLDSTAVAAIAQTQLHAQGRELLAYNWLPQPGPDDDPDTAELAAIRRAREFLGVPIENVELTPTSLIELLNSDVALDGYSSLWYEPLVRAKAKTRNVGLILSGWGGDELVSAGNNGHPAELLRRFRWLKLAQFTFFRPPPNRMRFKRAWEVFLRYAVKPNLPAALLAWRGQDEAPTTLPYLASPPEFEATLARAEQSVALRPAKTLHDAQIQKLRLGHLQERMETWAVQGAHDGIRYTYPLLDRRLVEFCLGMPAEIFADHIHTRGFFRAAMAGRLPDDIRLATNKFEPLRVARYIETMIQACRTWLHAARTDPQWRDPAIRAAASRYVDLDRFLAPLPDDSAHDSTHGSTHGSEANRTAPGDLTRFMKEEREKQANDTTTAKSSGEAALTDATYHAILAVYRQIQVLNSAIYHRQ